METPIIAQQTTLTSELLPSELIALYNYYERKSLFQTHVINSAEERQYAIESCKKLDTKLKEIMSNL